MSHFIGIDNSALTHRVCVIGPEGNVLSQFEVENSYPGFVDLEARIHTKEDVLIGFELPHGPLIDYLKNRDYQLFSLNPLKVKRYKEILTVSGNKNDEIDAHAIGEYLRQNHLQTRPMRFNSPRIEKLKSLSIVHDRLVRDRTRHLNKLHFTVRQYFPLHEELFYDFGCKIQLKMIAKYQTYKELKGAREEDIRTFLTENRYNRSDYINKVINKIRDYHQLIPDECVQAYKIEAVCLCTIIETLIETIEQIEYAMHKITDSHRIGKCLQSLPGAGKVLSGQLLGMVGDNKDRFSGANGMQCLFGTAPKNYQSGPYHKVTMRRSCNKSARAILYRFAFSSIQHANWARRYYDEQRSRGKTHSVAVRALSNKWVRVIYRIWKDETMYNERVNHKSAA